MPPLEQMGRHQYMVLWEYVGQDGYGLPIVMDGVELKVTWETMLVQAVDPVGNVVQTTAQIVAGQTIPLQSIVQLGRLRDVTVPYEGLHIIVAEHTALDCKGRASNRRREYSAMRYTQQMPTKTGTGT